MALDYMPFWFAPWLDDYKVQTLPRDTRLIFYDVLFLLWRREMLLDNNDDEIAYHIKVPKSDWQEAKEVLLERELLQLQANDKRVSCKRLGLAHDHVSDRSNNASNAAKIRWQKANKNK